MECAVAFERRLHLFGRGLRSVRIAYRQVRHEFAEQPHEVARTAFTHLREHPFEPFDQFIAVLPEGASRSRATRSFERGAQGEMFVLRELAFQGPRTPSQLAEAMGATSGRVSTILAALLML